jgi:hypothetical protein
MEITETIEEAAERLSELQEGTYRLQHKITYKHGFIDGAKWQSERMYNTDDVKYLMTLAFEQGYKKADVVDAGLEGKETDTEVNWIFLKYNKLK